MEIVLYGIVIMIGTLILMATSLAVSFFRDENWGPGILTALLVSEMSFVEYMLISKAIAEKIIGG